MNADITGLMQQPVDGWEWVVSDLCLPEFFEVQIEVDPKLRAKLTDEQKARLTRKLELVKEFTKYMATGMLKGTLKYAHDSNTLSEWVAHLIGEGADMSNYYMLLLDSFRRGSPPKV